jgi:hypothetical protein
MVSSSQTKEKKKINKEKKTIKMKEKDDGIFFSNKRKEKKHTK